MSTPQWITINMPNGTPEFLQRLQQKVTMKYFTLMFQCYLLLFKMMPICQILCLLHLLLKNSVHKDG